MFRALRGLQTAGGRLRAALSLFHMPKRDDKLWISKRAVLVGDLGVGKRSLVAAGFYGGNTELWSPPHNAYTPVIFPLNLNLQERLCRNKTPTKGPHRKDNADRGRMLEIELEICRIATSEDYGHIVARFYPDSHVIGVCFALDDEDSFTNILNKVSIMPCSHPNQLNFLTVATRSPLFSTDRPNSSDRMQIRLSSLCTPRYSKVGDERGRRSNGSANRSGGIS